MLKMQPATLALLWLSTMHAANGMVAFLPPETKVISLKEDSPGTCSYGMACKYAICMWQRNPLVNNDACVFVDSNCFCPPDTFCANDGHMTPGPFALTYVYKCRKPVDMFDRKSWSNNNRFIRVAK